MHRLIAATFLAGTLMNMARIALPNLVTFKNNYPDGQALFANAIEFDRRVLESLDKSVWDSVATSLQQRITDGVIDNALGTLPPQYANDSRAMASKLKARRDPAPGVWFGLGMMGLIGWSVSVPALLGVALGAWLDSRYRGQHSWTLALLVAGLTLGCFNAWHWVAKEDKAMRDEQENHDE